MRSLYVVLGIVIATGCGGPGSDSDCRRRIDGVCCDGVTEGVCASAAVDGGSTDMPIDSPANPAAPCLIGGRVMHFNGNDFIYDGMLTVTDATWDVPTGTNGFTTFESLRLGLTPTNSSQGLFWNLDFETDQGVALVVGTYLNAERAVAARPGNGIAIGGDGRGCNTIAGQFEIHEYELNAGAVVSATFSWEQHCEQDPNTVLFGCVHYE